MLSNAYFIAKFRFDTAENEPAKFLKTFCKTFCKNLSRSACGGSCARFSAAVRTAAEVRDPGDWSGAATSPRLAANGGREGADKKKKGAV